MSGCGCQECDCQEHVPIGAYHYGYTRKPARTMLHSYGGSLPLLLGALTAQEATEQIFPAAKERSGAGHDAQTYNEILASVNAGQILAFGGYPAYVPGSAGNSDCVAASGTGISPNLKLAQTASGLALQGVQVGLMVAGVATGPFAPIFMGISAIIGLFPMIFGHHAQAVKKEQSVLCTAVPAANNYLQIIDQAIQSGAASPQDGIRALDSLVSDFRSNVGSILQGSDPTSSGECNAACRMLSCLRAIVAMKQSQYQDLIAGAAQQVVASRPNTTAPAGTVPASSYASFYSSAPGAAAVPAAPSSFGDFLPIAAIGIAAFFFMRGL